MSFTLQFAVTCETSFGQKVCVVGNLSQLGSWNPAFGLMLETDGKSYPLWTTPAPVAIKEGAQVEFKLCVRGAQGEVVRWEETAGNRVCTPKGPLLIEFSDSDPKMIFKTPRRQSGHQLRVQNVRKGTEEVINEWGSDSSSNREMWREHEFEEEEEGSLLLTQFTTQLARSVASQREEGFPALEVEPEVQAHHQLDFGTYEHHYHHSHYLIAHHSNNAPELLPAPYSRDHIRTLKKDEMHRLELFHPEEVSLFHLLQWAPEEDLLECAREVVRHWARAARNNMRGLLVLYLQQEPQVQQIEGLVEAGVNVFIVASIHAANCVLQALQNLTYSVSSIKPDVFTARKNRGKQVKVVFTPFSKQNLLQHFADQIEDLKAKFLQHYYFGFEARAFEAKLGEKLAIWRMSKSQCLIIVQVWRLQELQNKTIFDLVHLSSQRFKVIVFVITHEKFPRNIQHRIPVARHKVIFINTLGDLYANTGQLIDLFYYLQINKKSFQDNQNILLEQLGSGLKKYYWKNSALVLQFPRNALGEVLRRRALRLVRDGNNKSIAKLVVQSNGNHLQFVPFCLHLSFLYRTILTTFALRLKHYEKGMVIAVDGTDLSALRYLQAPEGPQRSLKFLRFYLRTSEPRASYACNPISESQLQRMVELISEQCEEESGKGESPRKGEVLVEIKNLR